jgi:hypothetical protein
MTKSRHMIRPRHVWTAEQDRIVRELYADTRTQLIADQLGVHYQQVARRALKFGLRKSEAFLAGPQSGRVTADSHHGGRFYKGQPAWNKGLHYQPGGNVTRSQFKPGSLNGRAAQLAQPVGSFRINSCGYLDLKLNNDPGPQNRRWRAYHRVVWEQAHGEVPAGHVVTFKPGRATTDPALITLDALELVTKREVMVRNSYHTQYPPELAKIVQLRGALSRQINIRAKKGQQP